MGTPPKFPGIEELETEALQFYGILNQEKNDFAWGRNKVDGSHALILLIAVVSAGARGPERTLQAYLPCNLCRPFLEENGTFYFQDNYRNRTRQVPS